jgi:hypothetical protein
MQTTNSEENVERKAQDPKKEGDFGFLGEFGEMLVVTWIFVFQKEPSIVSWVKDKVAHEDVDHKEV